MSDSMSHHRTFEIDGGACAVPAQAAPSVGRREGTACRGSVLARGASSNETPRIYAQDKSGFVGKPKRGRFRTLSQSDDLFRIDFRRFWGHFDWLRSSVGNQLDSWQAKSTKAYLIDIAGILYKSFHVCPLMRISWSFHYLRPVRGRAGSRAIASAPRTSRSRRATPPGCPPLRCLDRVPARR
jgi:hypothetical protein